MGGQRFWNQWISSCLFILLSLVSGVRCDAEPAFILVPIIIIVAVVMACCGICKKIYECSLPKETIIIQGQPVQTQPDMQRIYMAHPTYMAPTVHASPVVHAPPAAHAPPPPYSSVVQQMPYQHEAPPHLTTPIPSAPPAYSEAVESGQR